MPLSCVIPSLGIATEPRNNVHSSAWKYTIKLNLEAVIYGTLLAVENAKKTGIPILVISTASRAGIYPTLQLVYGIVCGVYPGAECNVLLG